MTIDLIKVPGQRNLPHLIRTKPAHLPAIHDMFDIRKLLADMLAAPAMNDALHRCIFRFGAMTDQFAHNRKASLRAFIAFANQLLLRIFQSHF